MSEKSPVKSSPKLKEVADFLNKCAKIGLSEVKVGEIHAIFDEARQPIRKPRKAVRIAQEVASKTANLKEQLDLMDDEVSISHLEDPLAFEEEYAAGKLSEETHDSGT